MQRLLMTAGNEGNSAMTRKNEDAGEARSDAAADGDGMPPDGDLREPEGNPWEGCPVVPLGMNDGMTHWLDYRREYRAMTPRQLAAAPELLTLLGGAEWLRRCFPKWVTRKVGGELKSMVDGYSLGACIEWMLKAVAEQPMFGPHLVDPPPRRVARRERRAGRASRRCAVDRRRAAAGGPSHRQRAVAGASGGRAARRVMRSGRRQAPSAGNATAVELAAGRRRDHGAWRRRQRHARRLRAMAPVAVPWRRCRRREKLSARSVMRVLRAALLQHRRDQGGPDR